MARQLAPVASRQFPADNPGRPATTPPPRENKVSPETPARGASLLEEACANAAAPAAVPDPAPEPASAPAPPKTPTVPLHQAVLPSLLAHAMPAFERAIGAHGFRELLDQTCQSATDPTDRVELMMLEQLLFCSYRLADLHASAGQAKALETITCYNAASVRLMAEFRKLALALESYRGAVETRRRRQTGVPRAEAPRDPEVAP